jgi:hypothetical protein
MTNLKQRLLEDVNNRIAKMEIEIKASDEESEILIAKQGIENVLMNKQDIGAELREDFKYSAMALESMIIMEKERNMELKKDLEMAKYRKTAIENAQNE